MTSDPRAEPGSSPVVPRIVVPLLLLLPFLGAVLVRSYCLHQRGREDALLRVDAMTRRGQSLLGRRGTIQDRRGRVLAISQERYRIAIQGNAARLGRAIRRKLQCDPAMALRKLFTRILEPGEEDCDRLERLLPRALAMTAGYRVLCREVEASRALALLAQLRAWHWSGYFEFQPIQRRAYPLGAAAASVLGFVDKRGLAVCGVERYLGGLLAGENGRHVACKVPYLGLGLYRPERWIPSRGGKNVRLTIDGTIAWLAQQELARACVRHEASWGTAVVLDPSDGAVLAMESWPSFDPENFSEGAQREREQPYMNRAIHAVFQPGSIFKPFVMAAALELGVVGLEESFDCGPGYRYFGHRRVRDYTPLHTLSTREVLTKSSNIGMAQIGERVGGERLREYLDRFQLMKKTGIDLGGEQGTYRPEWNEKYSLISLSFGHEILLTPLRMAASFCAFANGGKVVRPYILMALVDQDGREIPCAKPEMVQAIKGSTSATVCDLLVGVMTEGTGQRVQRGMDALKPGEVGGKSGTTQDEIPRNGRTHYTASFIAFAPVERPRLLCLVVIDGPRGTPHSGSYVAGPAVASILNQSIRHLENQARTARTHPPGGGGGPNR